MDLVSFGCCTIAFILYYNTLEAGFVYDDRRAILTNPDLLPTSSWSNILHNDFWGTPLSDSGSHGSYRPLCVASFRLNYLLGGFQPWGYHLVNVLLHCLATGLVVRVSRKIFPKTCIPLGPTVAGILFATHPIHTEAVAGIVGRADLAACNFYLLSFLAYVSHLKYRDRRCKIRKVKNYCACCDMSTTRVEKRGRARKPPPGASVVSGASGASVVSGASGSSGSSGSSGVSGASGSSGASASSGGTGATGATGGSNKDPYKWSKHLVNIVYETETSSSAAVANAMECNCACATLTGTCGWRMFKQWSALLACVVLAFASMLCKETGITVLLVCGLYDWTRTSFAGLYKRQSQSLIVLVLALMSMSIFRLSITGWNEPKFATADNPTAKAPAILTRFLTFAYLPSFNLNLLICPETLSFDWSMDAIPRITSFFDTRNCITLFFYVTLYQALRTSIKKLYTQEQHDRKARRLLKTIRKRSNVFGKTVDCTCPVCHHSYLAHHSTLCRTNNNNNSPSICICQPSNPTISSSAKNDVRTKPTTPQMTLITALAFLTIPFILATNLFVYVGFVVAERVLYLPSVGYCMLLGLGAARINKAKFHLRFVSGALVIFLLVMFSVKTVHRNYDWYNEENLYAAAIPVNPPKAYGNLGSILSSQGRVNEAEWAFKKALEFRSNMADVHYNLGNLLQGKQKYDEAILSYKRAIQFRPSLALAYVNLGAALVAADRVDEAIVVLRQGSRLDGTGLKDQRQHESAKMSALLQLASLYSEQGRFHRALAVYKEAMSTMPLHYPPQSIYNLMGETLTRLQQFDEAERWYQAALQAEPDHVPAHITYGKLLAKNSSRIAEAELWFRRAQRLAPSDPSVYHHYGEFLASQGRHAEAAVHYVRASELKPDDYDLTMAAATALRQADRRTEAERWYKRTVIMRPLDARGHTNLGAMLHLNGKYRQAADSYREALRLQPDDVTTLTNLHKLYSVMA